MFSKTSLQRVRKIGDQLAVQVWMDYTPRLLPEYWREVLIERGVGECKKDGTIRLNRRGRRLRAEILQARKNKVAGDVSKPKYENKTVEPEPGVAQRFSPSDPHRREAVTGIMSSLRLPRPWREILARCNAGMDPELSRPRSRSIP